MIETAVFAKTKYQFSEFQVDFSERLFLRDGVQVPLPAKVFDTLAVLIARSGHLIEKQELMEIVWGGSFVEEGNLAVTISMLRKVLGDDREHHRYIETVSKRGYRFIADVREIKLEQGTRDFSEARDEATNPNNQTSIYRIINVWSRRRILVAVIGTLLLASIGFIGIRSAKKHRDSNVAANTQLVSVIGRPVEAKVQTSNGSRDPQAQLLYAKGSYYLSKRTEEGARRSAEYFQRATLADPSFGAAYSGLANAYSFMASNGVVSVQEGYPVAKAAALKAVQLDNTLAEAHASLGKISFNFEWDWQNSETELRRSIELKPDFVGTHYSYANYLAAMGRFDEALKEAQLAEKLDPISVAAITELGHIYYLARDYRKSIDALQHAIDLDPYYAPTYMRLGLAYLATGEYASAIRELEEAHRLSGPDPYLAGLSGYAEARAGNTRAACKWLAVLRERTQQENIPDFSFALIYMGLSDRVQALNWLTKAYQDRSGFLVYAKVDPILDSERSDPRFISLLAGMGLSPSSSGAKSLDQNANLGNEPLPLPSLSSTP